MGNNLSEPVQQNKARKYTDNEIKQNIKVLFDKNRNNYVETSYSLGGSSNSSSEINNKNNTQTSDMSMDLSTTTNVEHNSIGGSNINLIKFQSSKNRHLRHDIERYVENLQKQYGGGNEHNDDVIEFNKIKDYLINDLNKEQDGGYGTSDLSNFSFSSEEEVLNNKSIFHVLSGGKRNIKASTSSLGTTTNLSDDTSTDTSDNTSTDTSDDTSSNSLESSYLSNSHTSTFSKTSNASVPIDGSFSDTSYSSSYNGSSSVNTPYIVQSSESSLDTDVSINNSDTTTNSESSALNIVPFYSSDSSTKRPFVSKRFKH